VKRRTDGRTDRWTDEVVPGPKTDALPQLTSVLALLLSVCWRGSFCLVFWFSFPPPPHFFYFIFYFLFHFLPLSVAINRTDFSVMSLFGTKHCGKAQHLVPRNTAYILQTQLHVKQKTKQSMKSVALNSTAQICSPP